MRRGFTVLEITVVVTVGVSVAASAIAGVIAVKKELERTQGLRTTISTLRGARDLAVRSLGPVVVDHVAVGGEDFMRVATHTGGDCGQIAAGVTPEALTDPTEVKLIREPPAARLFAVGPVDGVCFKPRGGVVFANAGNADLITKQVMFPLSADFAGNVVIRSNGEVFVSGDAVTSITFNGTALDIPPAPAADGGAIVGKSAALALVRPEGGGGGGADIANVTGGGVPPQGACLGLAFHSLSVDAGYALIRNSPVPNAAYQGSNDCADALPIACITVPFGATPDPLHTFPAPHDAPQFSDPFYFGWTDATVNLSAPHQGYELTSRAAADALCAAQFPGTRMLSFHDGRNGTGGWGLRVRAGVSVINDPNLFFWTVINNQPANPWDYP